MAVIDIFFINRLLNSFGFQGRLCVVPQFHFVDNLHLESFRAAVKFHVGLP